MAHFAGLVAGGAYPDPVPHAHFVTSTTHKTLRGPRGGIILSNSAEYAKKIDQAVFPGQQGGALGQTIAAKALAFHLASLPEWREYALAVIENASALSKSLTANGQRVICAGKTHLLLIDLLGGSGKQAERLLEENNIVCNRNTIPFETRSPLDPSGLRLGSPALTSRGFKAREMEVVGQLVAEALAGKKVKDEVGELLRAFPV